MVELRLEEALSRWVGCPGWLLLVATRFLWAGWLLPRWPPPGRWSPVPPIPSLQLTVKLWEVWPRYVHTHAYVCMCMHAHGHMCLCAHMGARVKSESLAPLVLPRTAFCRSPWASRPLARSFWNGCARRPSLPACHSHALSSPEHGWRSLPGGPACSGRGRVLRTVAVHAGGFLLKGSGLRWGRVLSLPDLMGVS